MTDKEACLCRSTSDNLSLGGPIPGLASTVIHKSHQLVPVLAAFFAALCDNHQAVDQAQCSIYVHVIQSIGDETSICGMKHIQKFVIFSSRFVEEIPLKAVAALQQPAFCCVLKAWKIHVWNLDGPNTQGVLTDIFAVKENNDELVIRKQEIEVDVVANDVSVQNWKFTLVAPKMLPQMPTEYVHICYLLQLLQ